MNELGIFVDLAHGSPAIVEDVLNISTEPVMRFSIRSQGKPPCS